MRTAVPAITLKIRPAKLRAVVDTCKLRRVLNNLISNAVRHSGATRLVLGARIMNGRLVVVVADNGRGLGPEHRDWVARLSSDGERCEESLLREMDRLSGGLGLLIASRYAREMGASLEHVAGAGSGARFLIRTATEATRARQGINQAALRVSGPNRVPLIGQSIGILEQNPRNLVVLGDSFSNLGANVFAATDPVELLSKLSTEEAPDLLLVGLPLDQEDQSRNTRLLCQLQTSCKDRDFPLIAIVEDPCKIALRDFGKWAFVLQRPVSPEWIDAIAWAMIAKPGSSFQRRLEIEGILIQRWNPAAWETAVVGDRELYGVALKNNGRGEPLVVPPSDRGAPIQVLILEDQPLYAQMVRDQIRLLKSDVDCKIVHRLDAAIDRIRHCAPDVAIIDLNVPGASGLRALRAIKQAVGRNQAILVVMSGESDLSLINASSELGAAGFIPKSLPAPDQIHALSKILGGGTFFPKTPLPAPVSRAGNAGRSLSPKNLEVLTLVARGRSNKQIASAMYLSERQIKRHLQEISERLGTQGSRLAILAAARVQGLVH
jgi:two-component system, NarL family, nitrate/nitrite response regulator NarL